MGWRQQAKAQRARDRKKAIAAYRQGIAEGWIKKPAKKGRPAKNPAATFYRFSLLNGRKGGGGTYQNIHTAREAAQAHANQRGESVLIESAKGGRAWKRYGTVQPKTQKNPRSIRAKKIEIVRNARGQAVKLRIYRA